MVALAVVRYRVGEYIYHKLLRCYRNIVRLSIYIHKSVGFDLIIQLSSMIKDVIRQRIEYDRYVVTFIQLFSFVSVYILYYLEKPSRRSTC